MTDRRYPYPSMVIGAALSIVLALVLVVVPGSRSQAVTVEELTAGLTPGIPTIDMPEGDGIGVWNEVQPDGTVVGGSVCHRDGCGAAGTMGNWRGANRLIWNPIGAASWGTYYTNGLYVAANGQYVLPGETTVRTFGSDATPPPTIATTTTLAPAVTAPGGITGVEAYIINSNGVRCHLTTDGYWDHSRSCVDSSRIQFALCFQGSGQLSVSGASLGMSVSLDGVVQGSTSYPPAGVNLVSYPSCQRGYVTAWSFDLAERGRSYQIDVWGRAGGVDLASSWVLTTPTPPAPPSSQPTPESPTSSATTTTAASTTTTLSPTTTTTTTTVPTVSATTTSTTSTTTTTTEPTVSAGVDTAAPTTAPPAPPAGEATLDGRSTDITLSATDTAVTAQSGDVIVEVTPSAAPDATVTTNSTPSNTNSDSTIEVAPLQAVDVATSGFQPDSDVEIWLHSEPMLLARAKADATGALRTTVQIPAQAPAGDHRLVITGRSTQGETISVAMAVRVQGVPPTVSSSGSFAVWVLLSALILVAAVLIARRRFTLRSS
jgi:hypothetical protein